MIAGRRRARFICGVTVLTSSMLLVLTSAAPSGGGAADPVASIENVTRALRPFRMSGEDYTVTLHQKRIISAAAGAADDEALASLEIRNGAQAVVHREDFEYAAEADAFASSCSASAELLNGAMNRAILIAVGCLPSAPDSGATWEVCGVWDGKFMRLGQPFTARGEVARFIPGPVRKIGDATSFGLDVIELRIWSGNFRVVVPLTLSWVQGRLIAPRCYEQTEQGLREGGCDLHVEAERTPPEDELTFIRLFDEPHENFGTPRHVVVRRDSTVEIVGTRARVSFGGTPVAAVDIGDDPWLHVRVDGKDGWIHTEEDFAAVGLPQAG
jgi:hypothetical protein